MQEVESAKIVSVDEEEERSSDVVLEKGETSENETMDEELIEDVSGKTWELAVLNKNNLEDSIKGLYVYKNIFNLIPRSWRICAVEMFEVFQTENLVELERLQVKISSPAISGLSLQKLKALQELELSKVQPRLSSVFPLLSEIVKLKCLKRLAICHFSIRYLPPEIGCLSTLEDLDLSFNKLKSLPQEITSLNDLRSLKVANNKLEELPIGISLLQSLETLDLSNNRLTSLGPLKLVSMQTLKKLELRYNKLLNCCQIPSWICCNLEGNGKDMNDEYISSSTDVDVEEESHVSSQNFDVSVSSSLSSDTSSNRCSAVRRIGKRWKRQERLNSVRNRISDDHQHMNVDECKECKPPAVAPESQSETISLAECETSIVKKFDDEPAFSCEDHPQILLNKDEDDKLMVDSIGPDKRYDSECSSGHDASPDSSFNKTKRQIDDNLENHKPRKSQKPFDSHSSLSNKYCTESFCSVNDHLPDGFYDAGRSRPFMPLESYEKSLCLDSREVILVDRERDNELDVLVSSAKVLLSRLKQPSSLIELGDDDLQRATLLALFVSNWFGGGDRSNLTVKMQKAWSGSNYQKPFVCTCQTGNGDSAPSSEQSLSTTENFDFLDLCEKSIRIIKQARNSNVVPIGTLRWGVCRHRAVLMKYLCDRMVPQIPCELVRGYLDFSPHAWNIIPVRTDGLLVRMVVDACCPTDIREEWDPEYFCRYIPSSRINVSITSDDIEEPSCLFPSSSLCDKVETTSISSLMRYNFGSVEAVAKVRTLKTSRISDEKVREFEYTCLGEVRMLGALKNHPCIVEMYGHQIFSKWVSPVDGSKDHRVLQSAIWMEYIEGGSLKNYIEKLSKNGEKHVQVELAMFIARDIACALVELHSKHIIHRDIKSANILIDLDNKRSDGTPVIKLCDFDRAVPLRPSTHTCCIAHHGIPPPHCCVGTPHWMAPEVFQTLHQDHQKEYGLEVDIWSYGCLLLELLTLEIPYGAVCDSDIDGLLQSGQRPPLTDKLDALVSSDEPALVGAEVETENLRFLVDLFHKCTQGNPHDRPTAAHVYEIVNAQINSMTSSTE
ncbi:hypothetical protein AQUCO_00100266v1 [Aquilegia coerulea]|uniref:Protein kinase domain-containing protein n=1 Tax=Aquilegia coerulea TaxID=218851 RepID=A0A2G5F9R0_AQUCA|nr:hypothetical protein AQUCO_00100266v1 [Aquilegia coerulea]